MPPRLEKEIRTIGPVRSAGLKWGATWGFALVAARLRQRQGRARPGVAAKADASGRAERSSWSGGLVVELLGRRGSTNGRRRAAQKGEPRSGRMPPPLEHSARDPPAPAVAVSPESSFLLRFLFFPHLPPPRATCSTKYPA
jgi:hypothetical protein